MLLGRTYMRRKIEMKNGFALSSIGQPHDNHMTQKIDRTMAGLGFHWWLTIPADPTNHGQDNLWQRDRTSELFATELVTLAPVLSNHGLEVTYLTHTFHAPRNDKTRLITRQNTRDVLDAVFDAIAPGDPNQCLIEGAAGIGKSWNLIYLLRKLLKSNRLVVFISVKRDICVAFVPPQNVLNQLDDSSDTAADVNRYRCYSTNLRTFHTGASHVLKCLALRSILSRNRAAISGLLHRDCCQPKRTSVS